MTDAAQAQAAPQTQGQAPPQQDPQDPLRSVFTKNLPGILEQLGISLAVSTYQAGRLILIRKDGEQINTHFREFKKPMGIAVKEQRLTIGCDGSVWHLRNNQAVAPKIEPHGKHDACYIPRDVHVTSDIDIHEMEYDDQNRLWAVNTKFGCLCTFDEDHSFSPQWRPHFLSAYAPEDRCHLNGMAMHEGKPRYVTALGDGDRPGSWRMNKARGGVLVDVETNETLLEGLSMPHSPRVYRDQLWFLESGEGSLAKADLENGTWETVAQVPGFTRGIDFIGPLAFIGLSQVRETAVFSGIPLVDRLQVEDRACGIWVVNIETGETVGFLRFEAGVREIFSVKILPGIRYPEILYLDDKRIRNAYILPDEALAEVPDRHKRGAGVGTDAFMQHFTEGIKHRDALRYREAIVCFQKAVQEDPESWEGYNDLANAFAALNETERAVEHYRKAVELNPDFSAGHMNLGMALMKIGQFEEGMKEFEYRWRTSQFEPFQADQPEWMGEDISDKTLLVHTEQGAGDTMQFARFLPQVAEKAGRVAFVAPDALLELLRDLPGVDHLQGPGKVEVPFDRHIALMTVPSRLGTSQDTIPAEVPYLWPPENHPLKLEDNPARPFKVGFAWAGNVKQGDDKNRSTLPETFMPILGVEGVQFYSLQVGERQADFQRIPGYLEVIDLSPHLKSWSDTAAVMQQLDLIISVDTGVVHCAGSIGRPTWVMLTYSPDYRWLKEGDTSPWYPSMRLFRQENLRDWASMTVKVADELRQLVAEHKGQTAKAEG